VLRSRALEIAVEGCITSPLKSDEAAGLQQLLAAFIPRVDPAALASAIARLSELLAEDAQSFDTVGAAQRAAHTVISSLKAGKGDEGAAAAPAARPASLQVRVVVGGAGHTGLGVVPAGSTLLSAAGRSCAPALTTPACLRARPHHTGTPGPH
jgi:hypothetical protein